MKNLLKFVLNTVVSLYTAKGFLGAYSPDTSVITSQLSSNRRNVSTNISSDASTPVSSRRRRSLLALSSANSTLVGINNPTTCLENGATMIWMVTNDNYPRYDADNLYNTNPGFDYGKFRELEENHQLMDTKSSLFAFKFADEGVYVFKSSNNPLHKMVRFLWSSYFRDSIVRFKEPYGTNLLTFIYIGAGNLISH